MEIEVHQQGGVLGMDRRYLVRDGTIEVIDKGRSRGRTQLAPDQADRIGELAHHAAGAQTQAKKLLTSDGMTTRIRIRGADSDRDLTLETGDEAPSEVWDLVGEVSRASEA